MIISVEGRLAKSFEYEDITLGDLIQAMDSNCRLHREGQGKIKINPMELETIKDMLVIQISRIEAIVTLSKLP